MCENSYSYCKEHFNTHYAGRCPTCEQSKNCTWKHWICEHRGEITYHNVNYNCGHILELCNKCYDELMDCPVFEGEDGGQQLPRKEF